MLGSGEMKIIDAISTFRMLTTGVQLWVGVGQGTGVTKHEPHTVLGGRELGRARTEG